MGMFGKWLGGGLGFAFGGPIGGLLGFLMGTAIDESTEQYPQYTRGSAQGDFGMSLIVLIAAVMKSDGKVVKSELDYVKRFFVSQFGEESARQALQILKDVLNKEIPVREVCQQIRMNMDYSSRLQLLHLLFNLSLADAGVSAPELEILEKISVNLGISQPDYLSIRNMFVPETDSAYRILEVERSATNDEIKKAYRKMAMKYHPDKLSQLGEQYKKAAEEKFKNVNDAYEKIKRERNFV